jgi:hypothetical protein
MKAPKRAVRQKHFAPGSLPESLERAFNEVERPNPRYSDERLLASTNGL